EYAPFDRGAAGCHEEYRGSEGGERIGATSFRNRTGLWRPPRRSLRRRSLDSADDGGGSDRRHHGDGEYHAEGNGTACRVLPGRSDRGGPPASFQVIAALCRIVL